jgi:hypothetical protein
MTEVGSAASTRNRAQDRRLVGDAAKIRAAMEQVKVDTEGLRGGPIEWSKDNHFRTRQYYRVYRWDPAKSAITVTKDWVAYDVK